MPQLINPTTGQIIEPGSKIHTVQGSHAWRFERLRKVDHSTHHVHCSRLVKGARGRHFRGHREFHPSVFGLDVKIDITWSRHVVNTSKHVFSKIDDYLWAGAFAIIPLAFFEHYHMSGTIIETVTLGILSGGESGGGH